MFRKIILLLTLMTVTLGMSVSTAMAKPVHKLKYFQTTAVQEDGKDILRVEIGINKSDLEYTVTKNDKDDQQLVIDMKDTRQGKLKGDILVSHELLKTATVAEPEKKHTIVTLSLNNAITDKTYKVYTLSENEEEDKPYRLMIDIYPPEINPLSHVDGVKGHTIVLDPGHGGSDSGAIGNYGSKEKDVTLMVSKKAKKILEDSGARVVMTRETDRDVYGLNASDRQELQARVDVGARTRNAEVFVSIHCNAFSNPQSNGMETFYYPSSRKGFRLATYLNEELREFGKLYNRGVKEANFYVIKHSEMPASLVELGFITNYREEQLLTDDEYQDKLAFAIANALGRYFQ